MNVGAWCFAGFAIAGCAERRATGAPATGSREIPSATSAPAPDEAIVHVVPPVTCLTLDRLRLEVSARVRWRIASQKDFERVSGGEPARLNARLDDIVHAELRVSLANRPASEALSEPAMASVSALVREAGLKYGVEVLEVTAARVAADPGAAK